MRAFWTVVHRWAGLFIAGFLFISGVTGAVISWDHELDEWLNPHLTDARGSGPALPVLDLVEQVEQRYPQMQVLSVPLAAEAGHSLDFYLEPRVDPASGKLFEAPFNQVFVDPATGEELGKREWGAVWPITKETFVSFLYRLHYTLHLPAMWGIDEWGVWLLGIIAMVWAVDCFVGFYLTLPQKRRQAAAAKADDDIAPDALVKPAAGASRDWWNRWAPAWKLRWRGGAAKLNFDLHRAFSLWTWALLFIVAFTAFSLNLYREIFFPVMSLVSNVTPSPYDTRKPTGKTAPIAPALGFAEIIARGRDEALKKGWDEPAGSIYYAREYGLYSLQFFQPEDAHGAGGVGHRTLYLDSRDGRLLGDRQPWKGTAADIFVQAQFPLHSGRILGLPGRVLISAMGLVVAMLSVTGVVIWWKKRRARRLAPMRPCRTNSTARLSARRRTTR